ncbi:hypothetical protein ACIBKX_11490 [Streptomyces sp. NPDC050658]|uniref:hypothetical protein n=1 Tax=unclassified Streptomyces TaxID=2593676 RepID=UPI0034482774
MRKTVLTAMTGLCAGVAVLASSGLAPAAPPKAAEWQQTGYDAESGLSGVAIASRSGEEGFNALAVRDNKRPGQNRVAELTYRPGQTVDVAPLTWRGGGEPSDLEALDRVPGTTDEYLAVASRGLVYRLKVSDAGEAVDVLDIAPLPAIAQGSDFESFTVVERKGKLAAVWADRGEGADRPATVYAAPFEINKYGESVFGAVRKATFRAPYPTGNVRHASDIDVTKSGRLLISSASDAGNDGPFDSGVSDAGEVTVTRSGKVRLSVDKTPDLVAKFKGHKVEALRCVPGTDLAALGTDDENAGGALTTARLCD